MKLKKILKYTIITMLALVLVSILGLFIWSKTGTYPAGPVATSALESSQSVYVSQDGWIVFSPARETKAGLIFYPGGLVEPQAYAPVLHRIAQDGVLVVIIPMPFNLAIFDTGAANDVIAYYPSIETWFLAGHSLGGAAASIFADNNPSAIAGLALWDSYPPESADLSDNDLPAISIFGTTNGVPNTDNFEQKQNLLPDTTTFGPIEGASHAQFGDYGSQKGDVIPSISLAQQHDRVSEFMLGFISRVLGPSKTG